MFSTRKRNYSRRKSDQEKSEKSTSLQTDDGDVQQNTKEPLQTPSEPSRSQKQRGRPRKIAISPSEPSKSQKRRGRPRKIAISPSEPSKSQKLRERPKKRAISNTESEELKRTKKSKRRLSSDSKSDVNASNKKIDHVTHVQAPNQKESQNKSKYTKKASSITSRGKSSVPNRSRNTSAESNTETLTKKRIHSRQQSGSESETESSHSSHSKVKTKVAKSSNKRTAARKEQHNTSSSEMSDSAFDNNDDQRPISGMQVSCSSVEESGLSDGEPDGWQSDREFLQLQVKLLMSPFEFSDCFELASRGKRKQKDHISADIVAKSLRKLNYKIEDDFLKTLNRQAQRRITQQIQEIRLHQPKALENTQTLVNMQPGDENTVESLKKKLESSEQEQNELEDLKKRAVRIESLIEELDVNSLSEEINHTNKLLKKIQDKIKKQGFPESDRIPITQITTKGPFSHQDIVDKLFPK